MSEAIITQLREKQYDSRTRHFIKEIRVLGLPNSIKATRLLIDEMNREKGFSRHDGQDYFIHPIAVAQTALDNKIISGLITQGKAHEADMVLSVCLLHDVIEDVEGATIESVSEMFGADIAHAVDNVTKRKDEPFNDYLARVSSLNISALVKILDRLNNVSTLSESSDKHRRHQVKETKENYLELCEVYRNIYWEFGDLFFQAKTIMESILREIERELKTKDELIEAEKMIELLTLEIQQFKLGKHGDVSY